MSGKKRIDISVDGREIYFGGKGGLSVLKREGSFSDFELADT
jgi:hypothetical protein